MSEQTDTTAQVPLEQEQSDGDARHLVARFGRMGHVGVFRHDLETLPAPGTMLVVRTNRGAELAQALINVDPEPKQWCIPPEALSEYLGANGPDYPVNRGGKVLRLASSEDLNDQQHLDRSAREKELFCRDQIRHLGLEMKLICVEHLLGGERIVFYFISEQRVDFRELVRRLAGQYRTRIEMRQVGARDEARLLADYERCGRRCCCQEYLKLLKPVSMRMAKAQKATLDPAKISGRCGRLMCCLRYEDATYEQLQAKLPKKNTWVRTVDGSVGKVADLQILTQLVRLVLPNGGLLAVANEDIAERGVPEPSAESRPSRRAPATLSVSPLEPGPSDRARREKAEELAEPAVQWEQAAAPESEAQTSGQEGSGQAGGPPRKRRRRRRKKSKHPQALSAPPSVSQPSGASQAPKSTSSKKRRRRRRKKQQNGQPPGPAARQQ